MQNRRAQMRREERMRQKLENSKNPNDMVEKFKLNYRNEGMVLATAIMFVALHDKFGFSTNKRGTGRLNVLMDEIAKQSIKMDEDATVFNVQYYQKILKDKLNITINE